MPLILAIEPDRRQASRIAAVARNFLEAELVVTESVEEALATLKARAPELILTPHLLLPKDEAALDARLRQLDAAGTKVQTLVTPMLAAATTRKPSVKTGLLTRLRKTRAAAVPDGCEPSVFAAQINEYLDRVLVERRIAAEARRDDRGNDVAMKTPADLEADSPLAVAVDGDTYIDRDFSEPAMTAAPVPADAVDSPIFESTRATATVPSEHDVTVATDVTSLFAEAASEPQTVFESPTSAPEVTSYTSILLATPAEVEPPILSAQAEIEVSPDALPDEPQSDRVEVEPIAAVNGVAVDASAEPIESAPQSIAVENSASTTTGSAAVQSDTAARVSSSLLAMQTMLDEDGWEDVDLELVEAVSDLAPAPPAFTTEPDAVEPILLESDDQDELSAFVAQLEASLAAKPPSKPRAVDIAPAAKPTVEHEFEDEPAPSVDDYDPRVDLWMPLEAGSRNGWPRLETTISVMPVVVAPPVEEPAPTPAARPARGSSRKKQPPAPKPLQDEWGLFDPQQCGFAALLAKLDEVTDPQPE